MKLIKSLFVSLALFTGLVHADDYVIQMSWIDATPTGPEYVPLYSAQCQVDAAPVYEDLSLPSPSATTTLTFNPTSSLECRWRNSNIVVAGNQIDGNWSAWTAGVLAQQPADGDAGTGVVVTIHLIP